MANIDPEKEVETPMEVAAMTEAPKGAESGSKLPAVKKTKVLDDIDKKTILTVCSSIKEVIRTGLT